MLQLADILLACAMFVCCLYLFFIRTEQRGGFPFWAPAVLVSAQRGAGHASLALLTSGASQGVVRGWKGSDESKHG